MIAVSAGLKCRYKLQRFLLDRYLVTSELKLLLYITELQNLARDRSNMWASAANLFEALQRFSAAKKLHESSA